MGGVVRLVCWLAAVVAAVTAGPAVAAPDSPAELVFRGDGRSFVTIDIPAGVRVDVEDWALTGAGRYQLALLDRVVTDRRNAGFNDLFAVVPALQVRVALGAPSETELPAGRYRLYLISDKPARLRLSVTGMRSRTLTTLQRANVHAWLDAAPAASGGPPIATAEVRRDLALTGNVTFHASRWSFPDSGPKVVSEKLRKCLVGVGGHCPSDTGWRQDGVIVSSNGRFRTWAEGWDTFDYQNARGSAVSEYEGTDQPSVSQFVATISVK